MANTLDFLREQGNGSTQTDIRDINVIESDSGSVEVAVNQEDDTIQENITNVLIDDAEDSQFNSFLFDGGQNAETNQESDILIIGDDIGSIFANVDQDSEVSQSIVENVILKDSNNALVESSVDQDSEVIQTSNIIVATNEDDEVDAAVDVIQESSINQNSESNVEIDSADFTSVTSDLNQDSSVSQTSEVIFVNGIDDFA